MTTSTVTPTTSGSAGMEQRKVTETTGDRVFGGVSHFILIIWALIVVLPMLWTLMTSFKTTSQIFASPFSLPTSLNLQNYTGAWTTAGIGDYFVNTVIVVGSALIIVMILGSMCAYVLARFQFFGSRAIYS